jgi:hypothetical protein
VASEPSPVAAPALEGALSDVGLATVLAIFDLERRSGSITLHHGQTGRNGLVLVCEGRAVSATVQADQREDGEGGDDAPPTTHGRDALYELLDWRQGRFGFRAGEVQVDDELCGSTSELLLDAARRMDEGEVGLWDTSANMSLASAS